MSTSNDEYTRLVDVQSNDIYIKKMNVYILTLSNKKKTRQITMNLLETTIYFNEIYSS